jgi:hypothetical protein
MKIAIKKISGYGSELVIATGYRTNQIANDGKRGSPFMKNKTQPKNVLGSADFESGG